MPIEVQQIIDRLAVLGLSEDEAKVYVHLTVMGPSKASDVAAAAGVRRPETYRILQVLARKGHVSASLGRPTRFDAAPPERLFASVYAEHEAAWERVAGSEEAIVEALRAIRARVEVPPAKHTFRVLQGRLDAVREAARVLREAHRDVRLASVHAADAPSLLGFSDLWDLAVRRAAGGVHLRAVVRALPRELTPLPEWASVAIRVAEPENSTRFLVADGHQLMVWMVTDASGRLNARGDVAVWSDTPDFVGAYRMLFDQLWRSGKDVR